MENQRPTSTENDRTPWLVLCIWAYLSNKITKEGLVKYIFCITTNGLEHKNHHWANFGLKRRRLIAELKLLKAIDVWLKIKTEIVHENQNYSYITLVRTDGDSITTSPLTSDLWIDQLK